MASINQFKEMDLLEVGQRVLELSTAETREVSVQGEIARDYVGVYNQSQGMLTSIQSKNYRLVQHAEAFAPVIESLMAGGQKRALARIYENKARAFMTLVFPEIKVTPKDGHSLMLGFIARNSYNGTLSVRVDGYGLRKVCMNGMVFGKELLGSFREIHIGGKPSSISDRVQVFMEQISRRIDPLRDTINAAIEEPLDSKLAELVLNRVGFGKKRTEELLTHFETLEDQNRWGLYNAITHYASHTAKTEQVARRFEARAARVLVRPAAAEEAV